MSRYSSPRIGVIGGGQLAWMLGLAAQKMGYEFWVQTPHSSDPAVTIATGTILAGMRWPRLSLRHTVMSLPLRMNL
jgi:phosphoribosylaminoimidazole carboxylase (NCAIR synthetase)